MLIFNKHPRAAQVSILVNLSPVGPLSPRCDFPHWNWYHTCVLITLGPLIVAACLQTMRLLLKMRGTQLCDELAEGCSVLISSMIFLVFPSACNHIFSAFDCRLIDAGDEPAWLQLEADLSIDCKDPAHSAFQIYAGLMALVWPVGIPLLQLYVIRRNWKGLRRLLAIEEKHKHRVGLLRLERPEATPQAPHSHCQNHSHCQKQRHRHLTRLCMRPTACYVGAGDRAETDARRKI